MTKTARAELIAAADQLKTLMQEDDELDHKGKVFGAAAITVITSLVTDLDRIADAAERIAQALEDEDKIDAPQIENLIDQEPGICPVCEREGVTMFCGKPLCPKAPF